MRLFRLRSVTDRSSVMVESFCLKNSSSLPATSIRSRLTADAIVSPFCNIWADEPSSIATALFPSTPSEYILAFESFGIRYFRFMAMSMTTVESFRSIVSTVPTFTPLIVIGAAACRPLTLAYVAWYIMFRLKISMPLRNRMAAQKHNNMTIAKIPILTSRFMG